MSKSPSREIAKKVITTCFNYHRRSDKKDIIIISSPRSGSTWLMETLYAIPGIKYINEPLAKDILDYHNFLPLDTRWRYADLSPPEGEIIKEYFQKDKNIRYFGPKNIFARDFSFFTDRRVFKLVHATSLVEWFANEMDVEVIYLIRHPIAQSLSCIRRSHLDCWISEYLDNARFVEQQLNEELQDLIGEVLETGTELEKFVTEWCLANLMPLRKLDSPHNWLALTYEELVLRYEETLDLLYERLDLKDKEAVSSRKRVPSKTSDSSSKQTKENIESGEPDFLVRKWKQDVSDEEEQKLFGILEKFGIDAYQPGRFLAKEELLNFEYQTEF